MASSGGSSRNLSSPSHLLRHSKQRSANSKKRGLPQPPRVVCSAFFLLRPAGSSTLTLFVTSSSCDRFQPAQASRSMSASRAICRACASPYFSIDEAIHARRTSMRSRLIVRA